MIPRIQGSAFQDGAPESPTLNKWFFEIWISELGAGDRRESCGQYGPFETRDAAMKELRVAVRMVIDKFAEENPAVDPSRYVCMKTNETRSWDEH